MSEPVSDHQGYYLTPSSAKTTMGTEVVAAQITAVDAARVRHWHAGNHVPYPGKLHDLATDREIDWRGEVWRVLRELPEGARVSITVSAALPQGNDIPGGDDRWVLLSPHTYGHARRQSTDFVPDSPATALDGREGG